MYIDSLLKFSDAQALTATADSTNVVDLGSDRDIGKGEPMAFVVTVGVAADFATGDETYTFAVETDDNDAFTSSTVLGSRAVLTTELQVGDTVVIPIGHTNERYLQGVYTLAGTSPSITVDAQLMPMNMIDGYVDYDNSYTIV